MLPTFLIVGAEKAGTTTLAALLAQHPNVFMSDPKEPRFFSDHNWWRGLAWYESLFSGAESCKAVGEASPAYTGAPEQGAVPERIAETLQDVQYIYIVRHPVKRLISHYRHAVLHGWIPGRYSIQQAVDELPKLLHRSLYAYQVEQHLRVSELSQWHIVVFEEMIAMPDRIQQALFSFLGLDESVRVSLPRENVTDEVRRMPGSLRILHPLKRLLPQAARGSMARIVKRNLGKPVAEPEIPPAYYNHLVDKIRPDVERLSALFHRDYNSIWQLGS